MGLREKFENDDFSQDESVFYDAHPSMFRNHPVGFLLACALVPVGLGVLILSIWWLNCLGTRLTVTNRRTILRRGILTKELSDILNEDVRNIQVRQSLFQRLLGVGTVGISSAGQSGVEIEVAGIPDPEKVRELINRWR